MLYHKITFEKNNLISYLKPLLIHDYIEKLCIVSFIMNLFDLFKDINLLVVKKDEGKGIIGIFENKSKIKNVAPAFISEVYYYYSLS